MRARIAMLAMLVVAPAAGHETDAGAVEQYAENLADLRTEVESLSGEVELVKDDLRGRLRALETQKTDLEAQIRREEIRLAQLDRAVSEQRDLAARTNADGEVLMPVLKTSLAMLRESIGRGLPYHTTDRLAEVEKLENQLAQGTLRPQRATSRLWQFVEDELRLTRENALDRQVIELDDEEVLVDVARVGMVALFFRTSDGRFGRAVRSGDGWTWQVESSGAASDRIENLFDSLEKQIRVGWFEVPDAFPEVK